MPELSALQIILLIFLPVLMACSGFFSASETALFSLTRHQRMRLTKAGTLTGPAVRELLAETRALLITLLMGNMLVNIAYFAITTVLLLGLRGKLSTWVLTLLSMLFLMILIVVGEVTPKLIAARFAPGLVALNALPLLFIHRVVAPIRVVISAVFITPLARLVAPGQRPPELSPEELGTLLEMSEKHGVIDPGEETLLQGVLSLSTLKVRDLMTPRVDIKAFDVTRPPAEIIELIRQTKWSRVPVIRGDFDHVVGVVHAREVLLKRPKTQAELRLLIRQVNFVPEIQRSDDLLMHFRKTGTTLAIAVDEYGGTSGLVALVDVVEQMIGQVGESAPGGDLPGVPQATLVGLGVWRVSADLSVHDWAEAFNQRATPGVATLGGMVMARLGRAPRAGDRTKVGNLAIEVESVRGRRIESLILRLINIAEPPVKPVGTVVETSSGGTR